MTERSVFTDAEWHALTDAPLLITLAIVAAGEHGPISMAKEASASARAIATPGPQDAAGGLIAQIAAAAETKEARHDMKQYRGSSMEDTIQTALLGLQPAAAALEAKLPAGEAAEVGTWLLAIGRAVAAAAKSVKPSEQATLDKLAKLFGVASA